MKARTATARGRRHLNSNPMTTPIYQEIKDFILARIHAGEWAEGDQVPSENELAREFNVARMTVNRALRELTAEGRIGQSKNADLGVGVRHSFSCYCCW